MSRDCLLCDRAHEVCEFTAGSLYCIKPGCQNPHHRPAPPGGDAA